MRERAPDAEPLAERERVQVAVGEAHQQPIRSGILVAAHGESGTSTRTLAAGQREGPVLAPVRHA